MEIILIIIAIFPNIFLAYYVYKKDLYDSEPKKLLLKSYLLGFLSFIPILILETLIDQGLFDNLFLYSFFGVALIEEGFKFLILVIYIYNKPDFNEEYDGIVYAVMIGLGFSTIENVLYAINNGYEVAALRMYTAVPLHAACGVLMGYFVGLAKFNIKKKYLLLFIGLFVATLLHATYNYFLFAGKWEIMTFIALVFGIYFSNIAIKKHQNNSIFKT
jgi:protease PrsW